MLCVRASKFLQSHPLTSGCELCLKDAIQLTARKHMRQQVRGLQGAHQEKSTGLFLIASEDVNVLSPHQLQQCFLAVVNQFEAREVQRDLHWWEVMERA